MIKLVNNTISDSEIDSLCDCKASINPPDEAILV